MTVKKNRQKNNKGQIRRRTEKKKKIKNLDKIKTKK